MPGLVGKKVGMTSIFDENGVNVPCTVLEVGPCVVTQVKTKESDGYKALQLAFDEKKEKNTTGAMKGHFKKASTTPQRVPWPAVRHDPDQAAQRAAQARGSPRQ